MCRYNINDKEMQGVRINYGSPYDKVRDKALWILQKASNEYREKCNSGELKRTSSTIKYGKACRIADLYKYAILDSLYTFNYDELFMITRNGVCQKVIMDCVKYYTENPDMTLDKNSVSRFIGTSLVRIFDTFSKSQHIPYKARVAVNNKIIASGKLGVTNDTIVEYLKRHRIGYDIFEGCIVIR